MPEFIGDDGKTGTVEPAVDQNIVTKGAEATGTANPPIPEGFEQQTPEFLAEMIAQMDTLRQEQSELFAKMYPPMRMGQSNAPVKPPYEEMEMYRRLDREYDSKIAGLRVKIESLHVLLSRPPMAEPETKTAPPRDVPAPAAEVAGPI